MAVSILSKCLRKFVCMYALNQRSTFYLKFKMNPLKCCKRNLSTKTFHQKNANSMYKTNLAYFYNNCSKSLNNVSTYENLVTQKSTSNVSKKCPVDNPSSSNPGRHRFHQEIEAALNDQVEMEFKASFAYLSIASYYGKTEVALPGCQGYFMMMHEEEHEHAVIFLNYILMRGGHVKMPTICPPDHSDWKDISKAFAVAVEMEVQVKEKLEALVELSEKHRDHQLVDFISSDFLEEQNKSIQIMARLLQRSKMVKTDIGEYLFDHHLYESFVKYSKDNPMYMTKIRQDDKEKVYK